MNIKRSLIAVMVIFTVLGSVVTPVSAAGTLYVGTSGTNDAVTYDSVENAIENASAGDTIEVASGTYNVSAEVSTDNVTIQRYSSESSGTVTLDATNEKYGDAFYGEHSQNVSFGTNVTVNENVITVNESNSGTTDVYADIQTAVDNASANTTISIVPGDYNTSVNVTSENLGFVNDAPNDGDVTIDATNTSDGEAFTGNYSESIRIGQHLTVEESVFGVGGGAVGNAISYSVFGIPAWAIAVVALLLGYVYYEEME